MVTKGNLKQLPTICISVLKKFGTSPPEFGHKDRVKLYTAEKWDLQAWAQLFKESIASRIVFRLFLSFTLEET
tara:strand:+ start:639 stop:857 length:219 start_codon:yes stop_codon:yes gene_type:complete